MHENIKCLKFVMWKAVHVGFSSLCKGVLSVTDPAGLPGSWAMSLSLKVKNVETSAARLKASLRGPRLRKRKTKICMWCKGIFLCSFTKLLYPHTAFQQPKSSPLMWFPCNNIVKQYEMAITPLLKVDFSNLQCFSQEPQLGQMQSYQKAEPLPKCLEIHVLFNCPEFMSLV